MRMQALLVIAAIAAAPTVEAAWPSKPVRLIVGFAPGSLTDVFARVVAVPLSETLGQSVIVDNRPGANGNLATELAVRSAADGHTLLMSSGSAIVINPHVYTTFKVDPLKQLEPIAPVARVSLYLVVRPTLPAKSVADFLALARAQTGSLKYGSPGNGSSPHIAAEMFARAANTSFTHVPYKGSANALNDLLAGQIDFWFDPGLGLPYVKAGRLRMLATASAKRTALMPDVPSLGEANVHAVDADTWFGIYAPVGLPRDIAARLNAEIARIVRSPQAVDRFTAGGAEGAVMSAAEFGALQRSESKRFGAIVRAANIRLD